MMVTVSQFRDINTCHSLTKTHYRLHAAPKPVPCVAMKEVLGTTFHKQQCKETLAECMKLDASCSKQTFCIFTDTLQSTNSVTVISTVISYYSQSSQSLTLVFLSELNSCGSQHPMLFLTGLLRLMDGAIMGFILLSEPGITVTVLVNEP